MLGISLVARVGGLLYDSSLWQEVENFSKAITEYSI